MRHVLRRPHSAARSSRAAAVAPSLLILCGAALPLFSSVAQAQAGVRARGTTLAAAAVARHREALYVAGAATGVVANAVWRYHAGSRVGADLWLGRDKALHGGAASSLTLAGIRAGVRPWVAAGTVCAAGGAFELTQVRVSGKDATVNCLGAATAWAGSAVVRHWTGRR